MTQSDQPDPSAYAMQCAVEIEQHPAMLRPASTIISARIIDRAIAAAVAEALERGAETRAGGQNALAGQQTALAEAIFDLTEAAKTAEHYGVDAHDVPPTSIRLVLAELAEAKAALAETREYLTAQDVRASQAETELSAERALADKLAAMLKILGDEFRQDYPKSAAQIERGLAAHAEARKAKP